MHTFSTPGRFKSSELTVKGMCDQYRNEAAIACRDYAFHSLGLPRVVSIVSPENTPSQKVAQRVHDRKEVYRKQLGESGVFVDRYLYISEKR
ncbi:GNAT family N-acetyltransferase [Rhizobium rhizogenes]|uniref:GNAT family N-acetyltransferase n=1 Tax=Rhizobium rhizogenes TaxID=359 RepID=UPI00386B5D4D